MTELDRWQRPDGWPSDDYFTHVEQALEAAGVEAADFWPEEDWEKSFEFSTLLYEDGPLGAQITHGLWLTWRVNEPTADEEDPLVCGLDALADDRLPGWYVVAYPGRDAGSGIIHNLGLPVLAEPEQVAAAVKTLVTGEAR